MPPQFSPQLLGSFVIELALVSMTTFLLAQPEPLFHGLSGRVRGAITWAGMVALCVTFCWSVIVGCELALHQLTQRL
jgi:hypothetical protein